MHSLVSSSFVIVVTCFLTTTCQPTAILRYVPVISYSTGLHLCVVDEPSSVSSLGVSSVLQCALMCMESSCCVMYQMNVTSKQCQLFDYLPRNYCNAPDCHSFCGRVSLSRQNSFFLFLADTLLRYFHWKSVPKIINMKLKWPANASYFS